MPNPIDVIKPNSDIISLFQREPLCSVTKAEQIQDLLGQDIVTLSVVSVEPLDLLIGQKIVVFGKTYHLNQMPAAKVLGERNFEYDLTFEGPQYTLRRASFFNTDVSGFNTSGEFSLTGDAELFLDVLINNLTRVFGSGKWLKGEFPSSGVKTITFGEMNCLAALQTICKDFETEFDIIQGVNSSTLHIRKAGQVLGHTFQHGRGNGLYELSRNTVNNADIITRLWAFGSSKNLRSDYRNYSQRLRIDDPGYIEDAAAVAAFGVIEGQKVFEDIYPHRTGTVTGVTDLLTFQDSSMNFNLFEKTGENHTYLTAVNSAKIHFNTGDLAGYEFEVQNYNHATKTFKILQFEDERGLQFPNPDSSAFQIKVGDEYVILDINLPESYVESAELELQAKAQEFLDLNKAPKVQYSLLLDEMYLANLAGPGSIVNFFEIGDYLHILDDNLNIDKHSRIISLRRDVLHPYIYQLTIDDTYQVTILQQIIEAQKGTNTIIKINDLRDPNRARRGWKTTQELQSMVFDPDGYFDGTNIKPNSIETMMLTVAAKSQQFILQDVVLQPNFEGNANVVVVSGGLLIHYALKEDDNVAWEIEDSTHTIPDDQKRYIYAKVHRTNLSDGHIIFSEDQIETESDGSYYHFLVGALHSVIDGVRWISLTYGATAINGRFIKTGRIQSFDGQTYFDLDQGAIGGFIKFLDSDGNYRDLSDIGAQTDTFYSLTVTGEPGDYLDGKVIAWFQSSSPAVWTSGEEGLHEGDMWYNPVGDTLFRRVAGAWVSVADSNTLSAYRRQFARVGTDQKIQLFISQPVPAYSDLDLWMSPEGLRRSIANKTLGMSFDVNDWVEPFNFDNTATAIDGGIVTSGTILLAGDKNTVWAGITGHGVEPESVRFWAGASFMNRETAPFRVLQSGEIIGRTRIEVEGLSAGEYVGQAGMAGSEVEGENGIRFYAGKPYEERSTAPFRVDGKGDVWARVANIGNWSFNSLTGGMVNNSGDAYIIARSGADGKYSQAMIGPNIFSATMGGRYKGAALFQAGEDNPSGINIAAEFSASGAVDDIFGPSMNYAIWARLGISMLGELLMNGRRTFTLSLANGSYVSIDPRGYDNYELVYSNGTPPAVKLWAEPTNTHYPPMQNGKEVTFYTNNNNTGYYIRETIHGNPNALFLGGMAVTLALINGKWYIKCLHDNNW